MDNCSIPKEMNLKKNKRSLEILRYGIAGVATTVLNIVVYQILLLFIDYRMSNLIAIFVAKLFAYISNKHFVFNSRCGSIKELLRNGTICSCSWGDGNV